MLAVPDKSAFGVSRLRTTLPSNGETTLHSTAASPFPLNSVLNRVDSYAASGSMNAPLGLLMECAAGRQHVFTRDETHVEEAERISGAVLKSLDDNVNIQDRIPFNDMDTTLYPAYISISGSSDQHTGLSAHFPTRNPSHAYPQVDTCDTSVAVHTVNTTLSYDPVNAAINFQISPAASPCGRNVTTLPQGNHFETFPDFQSMCEHIWRFNNQKTSLYLQERLRCCVPGEYEKLVEAIFENSTPLMVHRFGNFLVQCMLELASPREIAAFARQIEGRVAELAKDLFCCHVIQRLLDVSPVVIQASIAAELLDDVTSTMCSTSGSHVWQKLLHLPWKNGIPPITALANNAVHRRPNEIGWLAITRTEAGCATIKSFLGVNPAGPERQECLNELLEALGSLIVDPIANVLAARVAMIAASRARALSIILVGAYEYTRHPIASGVLISLLHFKIPSFPSRLNSAIAPFRNELINTQQGKQLIAALELAQSRK